MTSLRANNKVVRKTAAVIKGRPVVCELHAKFIRLRLLGTQEAYVMDIESIFTRAAQNAARIAIEQARRAGE